MGREFELEKLRGSDNYHTWQFAVQNLLAFKGLEKTIKTTTVVATSTVAARIICAETDEEKCTKAKSIIILCIETSLFIHVAKGKTALEVWDCLKKMYEDRGLDRKIALLAQLTQPRLEECDGMQEYIDKKVSAANKLLGIGFEVNDEWLGCIILAGLTEAYRPMIMSLESSGKEISADFIISKLVDVQMSKTGEAFAAKGNFKKGKKFKVKKQRKCYVCKSPAHLANSCPQKGTGSGDTEKKPNAKETNGNTQNAFFAHAIDLHKQSAYCAQGIGLLTVCNKNEWYVDSGATSPMSPFAENISRKKESPTTEIRVANNDRLEVKCCGSGEFMFETNRITVNDILHVPEMKVNLLSVYGMVCNGNRIVFDRDGCKIYNKFNVLIASCKPENGIYKLKLKPITQQCMNAEQQETDAMLWHRRFGHLNFQTIQKLRDSVDGVCINNEKRDIIRCKVCPMGKQHRKPFKSSKTLSTSTLQLIHSDLCGPMENKSMGGSRYMLTLTDDFSRKTFVYFLTSKHGNQILDSVKNFANAVENETEGKIKCIRTDNGTEYVTDVLKKFFDDRGYKHELTCTYTPEQNGVAERANRTIVERAKCMLFDADLTLKFWAEACGMAVYLMNRTPRMRLGDKTPEEMWTGKKPNVTYLKIFGSKVMVHVPKEKRTKWLTKSQEMIFVGYDSKKKGYRCYDKKTDKVIVSRDVIFYESLSSTVTFDLGNDEPSVEEEYCSGSESGDEYESLTETIPDREDENQHTDESINEDVTLMGSPDADFKTRARIDDITTPRRGERKRIQVRPFQAYYALLSTEPTTVEEAYESENASEWRRAMYDEILSHGENDTWTLTRLPSNRKAIKAKWVFKLKTNQNDEPMRYKARLVAKGCGQKAGIDYNETFAPVVRNNTIRFLVAYAVQRAMKIFQMDAVTAFLQGELDEEIYMYQPDGFTDGSDRVCKLNKAVYGLKQAGRQWNIKLDGFLISIGFEKSKCDPCVYIMIDLIIAIYVDDFLIFYTDSAKLDEIRKKLHGKFKMKDIGMAKNCLGMNINQGDGFIELDQGRYALEILQKFGMATCKAAVSPSELNQRLSLYTITGDNDIAGRVPYQEVIGSLLYLANATRPDLAYSTSDMSRFNAKHSEEHWIAVKRILRYLRGTPFLKLRFDRGDDSSFHAYCDADWGSEIDDRKSRTGYVLKMSGGAISWHSKKQEIVALSSTEAEYIALSSVAREILWTIQLANEMGIEIKKPIRVYCDNRSAIDLSAVEAYRPRTKHIDIRHHHIREQVKKGTMEFVHVSTEKQTADSLTKAVTGDKTKFCSHGMGLAD